MEQLDLGTTGTRRGLTWVAITHVALVLVALAAVLVFRIPSALVLGAPSAVILLLAAADDRVVRPSVRASIDRRRVLEGDDVTIGVELLAVGHIPMVDVEFEPSDSLTLTSLGRSLFSVTAGQASTAEFTCTIDTWGVVGVGKFKVVARDRFGLTSIATNHPVMTPLRVHIHEESARTLTDPDRFRRLVGSHQSNDRGDGCEIADIRPYQPGDRLQSLNWRISARNDEPWVTLRHPDRSTTIVLLVDGFQRTGDVQSEALRRSVRATLGLARLHAEAQDPVGMMVVADGVRWIPPDLGRIHLHRLADVLLEMTTRHWHEGSRSREIIERQIPKNAIVVAVSPLEDARFVKMLTQLRARGQSVHVVEPVTQWTDEIQTIRRNKPYTAHNAMRIFSIEAQVTRRQLSQTGIPVIPWAEGQPIESVLRALRMSQRARGTMRA